MKIKLYVKNALLRISHLGNCLKSQSHDYWIIGKGGITKAKINLICKSTVRNFNNYIETENETKQSCYGNMKKNMKHE